MLATRLTTPIRLVAAWLPRGRALPCASWRRRHRGLVALLWAHVPALLLYGWYAGYGGSHALLHLLPVVAFAVLGRWNAVPQRAQAAAVSLGLLSAAAVAVHLTEGLTETHFLFFVLVIALALYEDWLIFLLAVGFVVVHHGAAPTFGLGDVYSHPGSGWPWAGLHGGFVLLAAALCVVSWRASEQARTELEVSEREKHESQLRETQKLESLGLLAGGVAHDFNNLLVGVLGNASLVLADLPPDSPLRANVEEIERAGQRAAGLTRQMLAYSGNGRFSVEPVELTPLVDEMVALVRPALPKQASLALRLDEAGGTAVRGDSGQLSQVVMNLVVNAAEALPADGGSVAVATGTATVDGAPFVFVEVADSGCGMDAETRARMFEPFYSTKFTGRGLGLAAVDGIVRSHGGRIHVRTAPGHGTTCRVLLPAATTPASRRAAPNPPAPVASSRGTVLLVDDEPAVLDVGRRFLERSGFDVVAASSGSEAVRRAASADSPLAAAVVDMSMPGLNGVETMRELRRVARRLPVVLVSGYATSELGTGLPARTRFLQKPYAGEALVEQVVGLIAASAPAA